MQSQHNYSIPIVDAKLLQTSAVDKTKCIATVRDACHEIGCFLLVNHSISSQDCANSLAAAQHFFTLSTEQKMALHIDQSPHFRGYSQMDNDRDWREQIHFGREEEFPGSSPAYLHLKGPNQWTDDPYWKKTMLAFLAAMEAVGQQVMQIIARSLHLQTTYFSHGLASDPYLLMKLICYQPQPSAHGSRDGVAPHCDYSLITLTLQDEVGGLQVRHPTGAWIKVPAIPGALLVNLGELMQIMTANYYIAAPHRVVNPSVTTSRISIPVFLNPNLDAWVHALPIPSLGDRPSWRSTDPELETTDHIHRVVPLEQMPTHHKPLKPFRFGEAEWQRKGLGVWCTECASHPQEAPTPSTVLS